MIDAFSESSGRGLLRDRDRHHIRSREGTAGPATDRARDGARPGSEAGFGIEPRNPRPIIKPQDCWSSGNEGEHHRNESKLTAIEEELLTGLSMIQPDQMTDFMQHCFSKAAGGRKIGLHSVENSKATVEEIVLKISNERVGKTQD